MAEETALGKFACPACGAEGDLESGQAGAGVRHFAAPPRRRSSTPKAAALSSTISSRRCAASATTSAGGRPRSATSSARAVRRSPCSIRSDRRSAANSAARLSSCHTSRRRTLFVPRACFHSRSARTRHATAFARGTARLWLAPNKLKRSALTDTVKGIYLPYWTFDARVDAAWTAEAGHYYYTTESYSDSSGRRQTRQVQHVRWESASGQLQHFFDDDLICASVGVHAPLLRGIEPFPTELKPYDSRIRCGMGGGALPDRSGRRREGRARRHGRQAAATMRRADSRRYLSQPRRARELLGPDVQAHTRARMAAKLHISAPAPSRRS